MAVRSLQQTRIALRTFQSGWGSRLGMLIVVAAIVAFLAPKVAQSGGLYFAKILIAGLAVGAIYALVAIGYTMVYGVIELINFAHGDVFTLGAFISLPLLGLFNLQEGVSSGPAIILPLIAVFIITMLLTGAVNVVIERVAYRPLRNAPRLSPLTTAVGMSFILEGAMNLWVGPSTYHYPDLLPDVTLNWGGFTVNTKDLIVMFSAAVLVAGLAMFINRSKLGKAMRATAQDRDAAQLMGIDINRTIAATFFIGAALAAAGGIIYGLEINNIQFQLGFALGLVAFTAAVLGGIGNIPGAALGGVVIGIVNELSDGYIASTWTHIVIFSVLILILTLRPTGLLGMRVPEK